MHPCHMTAFGALGNWPVFTDVCSILCSRDCSLPHFCWKLGFTSVFLQKKCTIAFALQLLQKSHKIGCDHVVTRLMTTRTWTTVILGSITVINWGLPVMLSRISVCFLKRVTGTFCFLERVIGLLVFIGQDPSPWHLWSSCWAMWLVSFRFLFLDLTKSLSHFSYVLK